MLLSDYINKKVEMAKMDIKLHERKYVWMDYAKDKLFDPLGLKRLKESYMR